MDMWLVVVVVVVVLAAAITISITMTRRYASLLYYCVILNISTHYRERL